MRKKLRKQQRGSMDWAVPGNARQDPTEYRAASATLGREHF